MANLRVLTSHPVQYHVPLFLEISRVGIDIEVGYTNEGTAGQVAHDAGFGIEFAWDIDLLSGYRYRIFNGGSKQHRGASSIRSATALLSWALRDRHTPLLLVGWFSEIVWLTWLWRIILQAPTLVMSETTLLSYGATRKPRWRTAVLRWLLQHTAANLFIGQRNREYLLSMGVPDKKLFHVPYSIDNTRFVAETKRLLPDRRALCHKFGLDPDLPTFLFCGKLIDVKRPLQLLEAYVSAGLTHEAQLIYVGDGALRVGLENRIQALGLKHVHLLGFLNLTKMPVAYVLGELLCLISEETWGLVVNEALACGRPVIISDTVGCGSDLVEPENGWVVPLGDQNELISTLRRAVNQRADWAKMGQIGRTKVSHNTFSAMAGGIVAALQSIRPH